MCPATTCALISRFEFVASVVAFLASWEQSVDVFALVRCHFTVDSFLEVEKTVVAAGDARTHILDEAESGNLEGFRLVVLEPDFVLARAISEGRVLELEIRELGVGDESVGDDHFLGVAGLFLNGMTKKLSMGLVGN